MDHIELHRGGREEAFPETAEDWPYIAERAEFARYPGNSIPWHWHSEVELFYMEQGAIDYRTRAAHEHVRFEEGSAGFINGGVLHSTLQSPNSAPAIQMLHIFQPSMLGDPADVSKSATSTHCFNVEASMCSNGRPPIPTICPLLIC